MAVTGHRWGADWTPSAKSLRREQDAHVEQRDAQRSKSPRSTRRGTASSSAESARSEPSSSGTPPGARTPLSSTSAPFLPAAAAVQVCLVGGTPLAAATPAGAAQASAPPPQEPWAWPQPQALAALAARAAVAAVQPAPQPPQRGAAPVEASSRQLVWCHERCHKQENMQRRQVLGQAAQEVGAVLVCLKKAEKFAAWAAKQERPPFALLTDWREAKPCLLVAEEQPELPRPFVTAVLAEDDKQFERACAWAESLAEGAGPVHVFQDLRTAQNFLQGQLAAAPQQPPADEGPAVPADRAQQQLEALPEPDGTEILSPLRRHHTSEQLEQLLRSAMPVSYDD